MNEIRERLAKFEESIKGAAEERKALREQLTAALATGTGDILTFQRRAAELDVVIDSAPDARKLLETALNEAKAHEAASKLKAVLARIGEFRERLEKAQREVDRAWQGIGSAISELRGLETPSG